MFAGFLSKNFLKMIKYFRQDSYQEDVEMIRFSILESNCHAFEWYINMKSLIFKSLEAMDDKNKTDCSKDDGSVPVKSVADTRYVNVDVLHQDRKKKHRRLD